MAAASRSGRARSGGRREVARPAALSSVGVDDDAFIGTLCASALECDTYQAKEANDPSHTLLSTDTVQPTGCAGLSSTHGLVRAPTPRPRPPRPPHREGVHKKLLMSPPRPFNVLTTTPPRQAHRDTQQGALCPPSVPPWPLGAARHGAPGARSPTTAGRARGVALAVTRPWCGR